MTILAFGGVVIVLFCFVAWGVLKLAETVERALDKGEKEYF